MKSIHRFTPYLVLIVFVVTSGALDNTDIEEWHQSRLNENVHRTLFSIGDIVDTITGGGGGDGNSIVSFSDACDSLVNGSTGDAAWDAVEECTCDSSLTSMSAKCTTTEDYCSEARQQQKVCIEKDSSFEMSIVFPSSSSATSCATLAEGTTTTTENEDLIGKKMCISMDLDLGAMLNYNPSSNQLPVSSCLYSIEGKSCRCDVCENKESLKISCDEEDYVTCEMSTNGSSSGGQPSDGLSAFKKVGTDIAKSLATKQTPAPTPAPTSTSQIILLAKTSLVGSIIFSTLMNLL